MPKRGASAMLAAMEASWHEPTIAVADIGGTHARFALAEIDGGRVVSLGEPVTLKTAEHASFQTAWEEFGRRAGIELARRARHRLCRAGRRRGAQADQQSVGDPPGADARSGWASTSYTIVNDFGAVAHAVASFGDEHFDHLCGPDEPLPAKA